VVKPRLRALAARLAALPPPRPLLAWAGLFLLIAAFAAWRGPVAMPDSATYEFWADRLIAERFDLSALVPEHGSALGLTYLLFVSLVALLKLVFGSLWAWALILLGALAVAGVGALLARLAFRITGSGIAAWAALLLFAGSYDAMQWVPRIGSDSLFLLFAYAVFLMEAGRILSPGGRWSPVFAASAAATLFRPTGIVLVPITLWSFHLARSEAGARRRARLLLILFLIACAGAVLLALLWQDPARWPFGFAAREIEGIARGYAEGQVVWDRRETYHGPPEALPAYWAITADRLLHFFAPGAAAYSAAHWAAQALFFAPVYALGAWFTFELARGRTGLGPRETDACFAALGAILAYALFHAVIQIDYDWRYRVPILPHLVLLAACGVALIFRPYLDAQRHV
jgi:hypothetical protein